MCNGPENDPYSLIDVKVFMEQLMQQNANTLAIVPIFVNTGVALLPAMLGALASVCAILVNPRRLFALCREKPHIPLITIAATVALYFGVKGIIGLTASEPGRQVAHASESSTDWAKVALEIIKNEKRAAELDDLPAPNTSRKTLSDDAAEPIIYRYGPSRCGYAGGPAPVDLVALWEFSEPYTIYASSPLVAENLLYSASCCIDPPDTFGTIFSLDADSGELRWLTDLKNPSTEAEFKGFFSSPALSPDGKYLVIGQGLHYDENCELVCLEAATGKIHWLVETELHIEGSPAVNDEIAVAGAGAIETPDGSKTKSHPGYVIAVSLETGEKLWRYQLNDPESSPVIADGVLYIGAGIRGNAVVALRTEADDELARNGTERLIWRTQTPHPATGAITLTEDLVLVGCGNSNYVFTAANPEGFVIALDRETGEIRWKVPVADAVLGAIAVRDDVAYCPVRSGELVALDLKNAGKVIWQSKIHENSPLLAGPAVTDELVYAVTSNGYLAVIGIADGSILEEHYINAEGKPGELGLCTSSPFIIDGRLYVGSETGGLRCFAGKELR